MYPSSRQVRISIRRTISLILLSCLSSLVFVGIIFEFNISWQNFYSPTSTAGRMLDSSQMLLAKEILLQSISFSCSIKTYRLFIIVKTRAVYIRDDFQRRMFIRTSWGREARSFDIPVVYEIGRAHDERTQNMLKKRK